MFGKSGKNFLNTNSNGRSALFRRLAITAGRVVFGTLLVLAGFYAYDWAHHSPEAASYFKLGQIHYEGLTHLDRQVLDTLIRRTAPENALLIDLKHLRQLVEAEAWVKEARLRRRLPGDLFVYVVERQPAAVASIDGELYVVDAEGVVLEHHGPKHQFLDRPIVKGLDNVARENAVQENSTRMQVYFQVLEELQSHHHAISEVDVEDTQRVAVVPQADPVPIYLGKEHFSTRYETFISQRELYERLKEQYGAIESVDMTFDDKIIFHTSDDRAAPITAPRSEQS